MGPLLTSGLRRIRLPAIAGGVLALALPITAQAGGRQAPQRPLAVHVVDPAGPDYSMESTNPVGLTSGTDFVSGSNCDDCVQPITPPFSISFFGTPYSSV